MASPSGPGRRSARPTPTPPSRPSSRARRAASTCSRQRSSPSASKSAPTCAWTPRSARGCPPLWVARSWRRASRPPRRSRIRRRTCPRASRPARPPRRNVATVIVVGLGPAGAAYLSPSVRERIEGASTARLRTRHHPAAEAFPDVASFDDLYDHAGDFDALYDAIANELVALARVDPSSSVVYAVPGSPVVAERTVALLRERGGGGDARPE